MASPCGSPAWRRGHFLKAWAAVAALLAGCAGPPVAMQPQPQPTAAAAAAAAELPVPAPEAQAAVGAVLPLTRAGSRWLPVPWSDLPGWGEDALHEVWNAWLQGCVRPQPVTGALCPEVRRLAIASPQEQWTWMQQRLQPYRVETHQGVPEGLLTGYYEPLLDAARQSVPGQAVPLYRAPADLARRRPWFTRQEIETLPEAQSALRGLEIAYLTDPLDALILQIQGSGRLRIREPDGSQRLVRLAFGGSNDQPYRSVGSWLLQQGALRDASWPGIKAWAEANPRRVQEMLWVNPRYVFFREEPLGPGDLTSGPRGAQGVPLTAGRSIAVDPGSIPYGTPVWLASSGPLLNLQRLVLAQDTGSAIVGAVRADYFAGSGDAAGELAGRLKQPLRLWVLWPR